LNALILIFIGKQNVVAILLGFKATNNNNKPSRYFINGKKKRKINQFIMRIKMGNNKKRKETTEKE
jgi:hypothetical protein